MASKKAANSKDPSCTEGTSQASTGATSAFADSYQSKDNVGTAAAVASKQVPAGNANVQTDSSPPISDWKMVIDLSSFRPYYYHAITNEVTWDKPTAGGTGKKSDPGIWAEAVDESTGRFYYHHTVTGQVTWVNPFAYAQQNSLKKVLTQSSRSVPHGICIGRNPFRVNPITPFRGIAPVGASGKWKAKISVLGKNQTIGDFESADAASSAYRSVRAALDESNVPINDPLRLELFGAAKKEARSAAMAMGCLEVSVPVALPQVIIEAADAQAAGRKAAPKRSSATKDESSPASKKVKKRKSYTSATKDGSSKATVAAIPYAQCGMPGCTRQAFPFSKGLCDKHYPREPGGKFCEEIKRNANVASHQRPSMAGATIGDFCTIDEASIAYDIVARECGVIGAAKDDKEFYDRSESAHEKAIAAGAGISRASAESTSGTKMAVIDDQGLEGMPIASTDSSVNRHDRISLPGRRAADEWHDDEISRLVEGIRIHGTRWKLVAGHVQTRTPTQCKSKNQKMVNSITKKVSEI